jgi:hypothetical protein
MDSRAHGDPETSNRARDCLGATDAARGHENAYLHVD